MKPAFQWIWKMEIKKNEPLFVFVFHGHFEFLQSNINKDRLRKSKKRAFESRSKIIFGFFQSVNFYCFGYAFFCDDILSVCYIEA
jgi:hypothetical protein